MRAAMIIALSVAVLAQSVMIFVLLWFMDREE